MVLWARKCNFIAVAYLLFRLLAVVFNGISLDSKTCDFTKNLVAVKTLQHGPLIQPVSHTMVSIKGSSGLAKKFFCCLFPQTEFYFQLFKKLVQFE